MDNVFHMDVKCDAFTIGDVLHAHVLFHNSMVGIIVYDYNDDDILTFCCAQLTVVALAFSLDTIAFL